MKMLGKQERRELASKQAQLELVHGQYMVELYRTPQDEARCLELAKQCLEIARGSRLEARFIETVKRHSK